MDPDAPEWGDPEDDDDEWDATFPKYTFRGDKMRTPDPLTNIYDSRDELRELATV